MAAREVRRLRSRASESGELAVAMRWRVGAGLMLWLDGKSCRRSWFEGHGAGFRRGGELGAADTSVGWSDLRRCESEGQP